MDLNFCGPSVICRQFHSHLRFLILNLCLTCNDSISVGQHVFKIGLRCRGKMPPCREDAKAALSITIDHTQRPVSVVALTKTVGRRIFRRPPGVRIERNLRHQSFQQDPRATTRTPKGNPPVHPSRHFASPGEARSSRSGSNWECQSRQVVSCPQLEPR